MTNNCMTLQTVEVQIAIHSKQLDVLDVVVFSCLQFFSPSNFYMLSKQFLIANQTVCYRRCESRSLEGDSYENRRSWVHVGTRGRLQGNIVHFCGQLSRYSESLVKERKCVCSSTLPCNLFSLVCYVRTERTSMCFC